MHFVPVNSPGLLSLAESTCSAKLLLFTAKTDPKTTDSNCQRLQKYRPAESHAALAGIWYPVYLW